MVVTNPTAKKVHLPKPAASERIGLEALIAPLSRQRFFDEYWERAPLVTQGRATDFFMPLFSIADVDRAICYSKPQPGRLDLVTEQGFVRDNFLNPDGTASVKLVKEIYLKGSTVILNRLEETWEPLAHFVLGLEEQLNHPIAISAYLTPPDFKGLHPHFDTQENFILQVEGRKHWRVYAPVQELPRVEGSYTLVDREKLAEPICETTLGPGDMLYIPRGFVHEGVAGDKPSLHITVDVLVRTWKDLLFDALANVAERNPEYRRSLPVGFLHQKDAMQVVRQRFGELLEHLKRDASLEDAIAKHAEALAVQKAPPPDGHFAALHADIDGETLLRRRKTSLARTFQQQGVAGIQFSGNQILGPEKIYPALAYVANNDTFTANALPGGLSPRERLVLARRMVRAGLASLANDE